MRVARTLWLLGFVFSSCAYPQRLRPEDDHVFKYKTVDGRVAVFDISRKTISYDGQEVTFSDCSDDESICLKSDVAKIVVPRHCNSDNSMESYISSSEDLNLLGLEGLSGNVFKVFSKTNKFGYGYNINNGLVQLILVPDNVNKNIIDNRSSIPDYTYRISIKNAPLRCR